MKKKSVFDNKNLTTGLMASALIAGVSGILLGGLSKMSRLFGNDSPQKLAEEMMAGAVRGILEHFEYKLDDLKKDVEIKDEEIGKLKAEVERYKQLEETKKSSKTTKKS